MKIASITVCRKGSTRIPNKTWQKINGKPLIENKIDQLKQVSLIDEIIVGSDDDEVGKLCDKKEVTHVRRPDYYCDESQCTANEMIKNMLSYVNADIIVWAHATNPFITAKHYTEALNTFLSLDKKYDSVFSAIELKEHFWGTDQKPLNHNPWGEVHVVARDVPPIYKQNGGIFIQYKKNMEKSGRFIGNKPYMYVMNEMDGWDIDYPWQLESARSFEIEQ